MFKKQRKYLGGIKFGKAVKLLTRSQSNISTLVKKNFCFTTLITMVWCVIWRSKDLSGGKGLEIYFCRLKDC